MESDGILFDLLVGGITRCHAAVSGREGLFVSLFMAGLAGSLGHCVGMCGPFVVAQTLARFEGRPAAVMKESDRWTGALLLPYHLGRITTYAALGAGGALAAGWIGGDRGVRWPAAVLLAIAALFFLGYGLGRLGLVPAGLSGAGGGAGSRHLAAVIRPLFSRPAGFRGYLLGAALGFLPCGLLYGALAAAAAAGDPLAGALAMAAFALGTVPALVAAGTAGHLVAGEWRAAAAKGAAFLLMGNAVSLSYMAWRLVT